MPPAGSRAPPPTAAAWTPGRPGWAGPSTRRRPSGPWRSGCSRGRRHGAPPSTTCWWPGPVPAAPPRGQGDRGPADLPERPAPLDPAVDMEPARAGRLRPPHQAEVLEHLPGHQGHVEYLRPGHPGHRVEVDPELVGMVEVVGAHRVGVQVDATEVDHPGELGGVPDD